MVIRIRFIATLMSLLAAFTLIAGCKNRETTTAGFEPPVVITLWHAYNAVAKTEFDQLVRDFNETVGAEKGIIIDATGYGSSDELEEVLYASANRMLGSEPLPDIFAAYPDSAYRLDKIVPLASLDDYFTEEEWAGYRPEFLEEGIWSDSGIHKLIPVAKSTELLYLNRTAWEEFSGETGASGELLETWEGLTEAAGMYYEWSGGKPFLGMNSYSDFAVLTAAQLGENITPDSGGFQYGREAARRVWDIYYVPHIKGWYESRVYNQDGVKSGKLAAYIGSSAGAGFFPEVIIEDEKNSYPVECESLPYPSFRDGEQYMTQRGANMGVFSSEQRREEAACEFLRWFTAPKQNIRFAVRTGYLPVREESLKSVPELLSHIDDTNNAQAIKNSIDVFLEARAERPFYIHKVSDGSYERNKTFGESLEKRTAEALGLMKSRAEAGENKDKVMAELIEDSQFNRWYESLMKEMAGITDGEKDKK